MAQNLRHIQSITTTIENQDQSGDNWPDLLYMEMIVTLSDKIRSDITCLIEPIFLDKGPVGGLEKWLDSSRVTCRRE